MLKYRYGVSAFVLGVVLIAGAVSGQFPNAKVSPTTLIVIGALCFPFSAALLYHAHREGSKT